MKTARFVLALIGAIFGLLSILLLGVATLLGILSRTGTRGHGRSLVPDLRYCPWCGQRADPRAPFCRQCGKALTA